jgi:hypothetical protein
MSLVYFPQKTSRVQPPPPPALATLDNPRPQRGRLPPRTEKGRHLHPSPILYFSNRLLLATPGPQHRPRLAALLLMRQGLLLLLLHRLGATKSESDTDESEFCRAMPVHHLLVTVNVSDSPTLSHSATTNEFCSSS